MTKTKFLYRDDVHRSLCELNGVLSTIFTELQKISDSDFYIYNNNTYQFITKVLKSKDRINNPFLNLLCRNLYQIETISGGSSIVGLLFALNLISEYQKNSEVVHDKHLNEFLEFVDNECRKFIEIPTIEDIQNHIKMSCGDDNLLEEVISTAIEASGLEGKIFVEDGYQANYVIESKQGFVFDLEPFKMFFQNSQFWEADEIKILLIDGLLEEVSEIDHLLTKAYETKAPLAIIAHGFSEEIVATCMKNMMAGNLNVLPIRTKRDVGSINTIADIATICDTQPISHLIGNMVSMTKWEDLATIKKLHVTQKETTFITNVDHSNINAHIKGLLSKRNSTNVEDLRDLVDKRLRSLVSHSVVIYLPNQSQVQNNKTRLVIDNCLRDIKSIINYGTMNTNAFLNSIKEHKSDMLIRALKNTVSSGLVGNKIPFLSFVVAIKTISKTCLLFLNSSGMVIPEA